VLVVAVAAWIGWQWGPAAYRHAEYLRLQNECKDWNPPEGTVVFEQDPVRVRQLLTSPLYSDMPANVTQNLKTLGFPPVQIALCQGPDALRAMPRRFLGHGGGVAFLHELRSPGGNRRLVFIPLGIGEASAAGYWIGMREPIVFSLAPNWPPRDLQAVGKGATGAGWGSGDLYSFHVWWKPEGARPLTGPKPNIRLYAGHPDPADTSHFTMRYDYLTNICDEDGRDLGEVWKSNVLHGWLRDDDSVELKQEHAGGHFENLPTLR
jgi:hypothetical protein